MLAIHTKFIPATNTKSARIKAYTCNGHASTIPVDYELGEIQRHSKAVKTLIEKELKYATDYEQMAYGGSADNKGYTFCFIFSTVKVK